MRRNVGSGAPWESIAGYSRAVRVGNTIHVAGTTATDPNGGLIGAGDAALQTRRCLEIIEHALQELDAELKHVVRTRMFVTHIHRDWEDVARVHGEVFGEIRPVTAMVEVSGLVDPEMLVEIEAVAIIE